MCVSASIKWAVSIVKKRWGKGGSEGDVDLPLRPPPWRI
jgi:hypothetical protein